MAYERHQQYSIVDWIINNNVDPEHKLIRLTNRIDWDEIIEKLSIYYSTKGRKAKRIRMMVALHMVKHLYNLSDEQVVEGLQENLYWMAFCGVPTEQIAAGGALRWLEASTMTKFRKRIGAEGMNAIEEVIRDQILSDGRRRPRAMIVDTTCMEKHIAYPTDAGLLDKGRRKLVRMIRNIKDSGVAFRGTVRSYVRVGKKALCEINKFGRTSQKTVRDSLTKLVYYAERVMDHVPEVLKETKVAIKRRPGAQLRRLSRELEETAERVRTVLRQTKERLKDIHVPDKLYSLHEPQVACITKGKRPKEHEYGCKVSLAINQQGYVIAHREYPDNRHDNQTLTEALDDWKEATGTLPEVVNMDRGYRYKEGNEPKVLSKVRRVVIPSMGKTSIPQERTRWFKKHKRKRSSIEAVISHLKQEHRMDRCRYRGLGGDQVNMSLATIAWNTKKWALDTG